MFTTVPSVVPTTARNATVTHDMKTALSECELGALSLSCAAFSRNGSGLGLSFNSQPGLFVWPDQVAPTQSMTDRSYRLLTGKPFL